MLDWIVPSGSVLVAAGVGWLTYIVSNRAGKTLEASTLLGDSMALKDDYKEAYEGLKEEIHELRQEIELLRSGMEDCARWKGVAVAVTAEFREEMGIFPLGWPEDEPLPAAGI